MSKLRRLARTTLGWAAWPLAAPLVDRCIGGDRGLILMFHHVGPPVLPGAEDYLFLSPAELERILDFVQQALRPLAPLEFIERLATGTLPPRATLLTFDDGTYDQVVRAGPLFAARGLQACFFVCPGLIEARASIPSLELATCCQHARPGRYSLAAASQATWAADGPATLTVSDQASRVRAYNALLPRLLRCPSRQQPQFLADIRTALQVADDVRCPYPLATWEQLNTLAGMGMYVGNHTLWHSTATADGNAQFAADVAAAFAALEAHLPPAPRWFCYPYGRPQDVTAATTAALQAQGVRCAFVVQGGLARLDSQGLLALHREAIVYNVHAARLATLLACLR